MLLFTTMEQRLMSPDMFILEVNKVQITTFESFTILNFVGLTEV